MRLIHLEEVVQAVKSGEQSEIDVLIEKLKPLILSMIKKYGYLDTFEENFQNAMVVLLESIKEYDPNRDVTFSAYYKKRLFYHFVNALKIQNDHIKFKREIESLDKIEDCHTCEENQCLDQIIWREERSNLYKAINQLTSRQKWLVMEHYFKGKRLKDLSIENSVHYQSLVKLKSRTLKNLKRQLTKQYIN